MTREQRNRQPLGSADRSQLAKQEESLICALLQQSRIPAFMDEKQIATAARSLLLKRARVIAKIDPELMMVCGDQYFPLVEAYSQIYPGAHANGAHADVAQFRAYLRKSHPRRSLDLVASALGFGRFWWNFYNVKASAILHYLQNLFSAR